MALTEGLPFYAPLPVFGESLSRQWDRFRENSDALAPLVRGATYDVGATSRDYDLSGLAIGELDFRNRHRIFYNKTDNQFEIQFNQGTETNSSWTTYMCIRDSDGRLIAKGPGGFESLSGFYNASFLTIRTTDETQSNATHKGVAEIVFNANDFYLTGSKAHPHVNLQPTINQRDFQIGTPSATEDRTWFFTPRAITVQKTIGLVKGTGSAPHDPHVAVRLLHGADRLDRLSATAANSILNNSTGFYIRESTTGIDLPINTGDVTIPASSFVWIESTGTGGTPSELFLTLEYTED